MKLSNYENPLTGKKENLFDIGSMFSKVLGVVVMFFVVATGQNLARTIGSKTKLDTSVEPLITRPMAESNPKRVY